ncbi:hypothetical protein AAur_pTC20064 (plasmid) [Paenarthrobacter aurescens TC1]|uniref:Uncharacterized protein n=1 Tax=Paenarthrobacter aurescens (strain TC1) TaxID=290340 RepID=A1RDB7_PAEAT|nr:hypothetical protein AAur_pTC20064 [Paenarthrobacter aurescens TC1]
MAESIPVALQPPVAVALAKLIKTFPGPAALPGGVWMEPKWDGFIHWTSSRVWRLPTQKVKKTICVRVN